MENAVIYARYSSHSQTEQSIEGQLSAAYKYAEVKGYQVIEEYCDRAKTGTNDNRAEFQRMLHDASKHTFTVVIVWKVDRFGRNREEIAFNKYHCKKNGVRVEYVAENIAEGPEGVILEAVLEGMAEYYSLQLSQNIKRGLLESAKKHKVIGNNLPLGYKPGPDKEYVLDPEGVKVVQLIYDKYIEGYSVSEIIDFLNARGYKTKYNKPFTKSSVPRILHNETYTGVYTYKDIVRDEDAVPIIIDKEKYNLVQDMMKERKRKPSARWNYTDFILTDKIFCGTCGDKMFGTSGYGRSGQKYQYYKCVNGDRKPIRQDYIEKLVIDEVKNILKDDETRNYIIDLVWGYYLEQEKINYTLLKVNSEITEINKSIANILMSIEQGLPYAMVRDRLDELNAQKEALELTKAKEELSENIKLTREHIEFFMEQFLYMDFDDRHCQKKLVKVFVNSVFVFDDRLDIVFNYTDDNPTTELKTLNIKGKNVRVLSRQLHLSSYSRTITVTVRI